MFNNFFLSKIEPFVRQCGNMRIRIQCWIPKATARLVNFCLKINLLLIKVQNIYINFLFKTVPDTSLYETSNLREAMKVYHGGNMYASGSEKRTIHEKTTATCVNNYKPSFSVLLHALYLAQK